jgi:surface antigen
MSCPREPRRSRLLASGVLLAALLGLVGLSAPSYADDDYPYRGLGQCPLVPLPPVKPSPPGQPGHPGHPGQPGHPGNGSTSPGNAPHGPQAPHQPGGPATPGPTSPPTPSTPPAPRECAKHIWIYNGTYGDPWGFALRNCTSFVAWRLRETNGVTDFSNYLDGGSWGDARHWDDNAEALGYLVDDVPAVGAVAQTDHGRVGHVAWVSAVGDGTVTVEEYNYYTPGAYDVRTVPTSTFRYLHIADVAPAPDLGPTRAAGTAVDVRGLTWTARVSPAGDLTVHRPSGHDVRVGVRGAWSTSAAPSLAADDTGRVWLAGVTGDGRILTAHTSTADPRWSRLRPLGHGGWSATSTPTLAVDGRGRLHVFALTVGGTMLERHLVRPGSERWSLSHRLGAAGSWSPQTAAAATTDRRGRTWLVAVTRHGSLQARHSNPSGSRWSAFRAVDGRTWSLTSTPALTTASDGRLWLASVTERGTLVSRHTGPRPGRWLDTTELGGTFSPYASAVVAPDDTGRLWLAAVDTGGHVVVRAAGAGHRWGRAHPLAAGSSVTDGPALVALPSGGMRVGLVRPDGSPSARRIGAPRRGVSSARGGGFSSQRPLGL